LTQHDQRYQTTDNGVQIYFISDDMGYSNTLLAKKDGKTLWKKDYPSEAGILAVEGNLIFLWESTYRGGPVKLIVLNTQGKVVSTTTLNGSIVYNGYSHVRAGDHIYFVTDRWYERLSQGYTDPETLYSRIVAVSVKTGKVVWTKGSNLIIQPPVLHKGYLYVTDDFKGLIRCDTNGNLEVLIKDESLNSRPYFGPNDQVYFSTYERNKQKESLKAYDQNYKLLWEKPYEGSLMHLNFDKGLVILSTSDSYDANNSMGYDFNSFVYGFTYEGKLLWRFKHQGYNSMFGGPIVSSHLIYLLGQSLTPAKEFRLPNDYVAFDTRVYAINKWTGAVEFKTDIGAYYFPGLVYTKNPKPIIEQTSSTGKKTYYLLQEELFKDIASTFWAIDEVSWANSHHIINGYPDGRFRPNDTITHGQAALMLARALKLDTTNVPDPGFKDVSKDAGYYPSLAALIEQGIWPKGDTFGANQPLKREMMAILLARAFNLSGTAKSTFKDISPDHHAYQEIAMLAENNITIGYEDNTFRPSQSVTRTQFAVFLARSMEPMFRNKK
jgi:hypothetical protein